MQFINETRFKINESIISSSIGDKLILLNINTGKYIEISDSGEYIWHLLENSETSQYNKILSNISSNYNGDIKDIVKDVDNFLIQAMQLGLIDEK